MSSIKASTRVIHDINSYLYNELITRHKAEAANHLQVLRVVIGGVKIYYYLDQDDNIIIKALI